MTIIIQALTIEFYRSLERVGAAWSARMRTNTSNGSIQHSIMSLLNQFYVVVS